MTLDANKAIEHESTRAQPSQRRLQCNFEEVASIVLFALNFTIFPSLFSVLELAKCRAAVPETYPILGVNPPAELCRRDKADSGPPESNNGVHKVSEQKVKDKEETI